MSAKPAAEGLGIDLESLRWRRPAGAGSGESGTLEVAMAHDADGSAWVLLRVGDDPAGRVLVYDEDEWDCFLDGVRNGEFDVPRQDPWQKGLWHDPLAVDDMTIAQ